MNRAIIRLYFDEIHAFGFQFTHGLARFGFICHWQKIHIRWLWPVHEWPRRNNARANAKSNRGICSKLLDALPVSAHFAHCGYAISHQHRRK